MGNNIIKKVTDDNLEYEIAAPVFFVYEDACTWDPGISTIGEHFPTLYTISVFVEKVAHE